MTPVLTATAGRAALLVTAAALLAGALTLVATRRPGTALQVLLDLLLSAGLLRLSGDPGWPAIATAAAIVALRRLIGVGLRAGAGAWTTGSGRTPGDRQPGHRGPAGALRRFALDRLLRPAWRP